MTKATTHTAASGTTYTYLPTNARRGAIYLGNPATDGVLVDDDVAADEVEYAVDRADEEVRTLAALESL